MSLQDKSIDFIVGKSKKIQELKRMIKKAARHSRLPVLITGETGTGKDLVARALHVQSNRKDRPFKCLNCSTIPETLLESMLFGHKKGAFTGAISDQQGLVEAANGGILFLDEIGDMDSRLQPKLLRFLEDGVFRRVGEVRERSVDIQLVAATNKELLYEIQSGTFRQDLYYRLCGVNIHVPSLSEHKEDIPQLVAHFLNTMQNSNGNQTKTCVVPEVMAILMSSEWPGNVRELKHTIEVAFLNMKESENRIELQHLPPEKLCVDSIDSRQNFNLREMERQLIKNALHCTEFKIRPAAQLLGIDRKTLRRKMDVYNLTSHLV